MDRRPIIHVHIYDDRTGALLADVDARSTADGLAYYLASRHIVDDATEATVAAETTGTGTHPILFEQRCPITNVVERALFARVGP
jgi:hypothetical protein